MKQPGHSNPLEAIAAAPARQTRLRALLFPGEALGTTLSTAATASPKIPPFVGE